MHARETHQTGVTDERWAGEEGTRATSLVRNGEGRALNQNWEPGRNRGQSYKVRAPGGAPGEVSMWVQGLGTPGQKQQTEGPQPTGGSFSCGAGKMERKGKGRTEDPNPLGILFPEKCPKCSPSMNTHNILCTVPGVPGAPKARPETQTETPPPSAACEEQRAKGRAGSIST